MFTGIVEETGTVKEIRRSGRSVSLKITADKTLEGTRTGDSIAVDGVCLTVTDVSVDGFTADVMPESMNRTTIQYFRPGSPVNLERALQVADRLGGHFVTGHIDATGRILERRKDDTAEWFRISVPAGILKYIAEKGSVAVDGISLTIARIEGASFSVSIIPHTQSATTILQKRTGAQVNIECDILAKYVEKLIR
jgi:riboflavin synthase